MLPVAKIDAQTDAWDGRTFDWIPTTKAAYFDRVLEGFLEPGTTLALEEVFEILEVCPAGFVDAFTSQVVQLESDASTYHVLPQGRGIFHETQRLMDAFRTIRAARDDFYAEEQRRRAAKAKARR